jgi:hypothetical protein
MAMAIAFSFLSSSLEERIEVRSRPSLISDPPTDGFAVANLCLPRRLLAKTFGVV